MSRMLLSGHSLSTPNNSNPWIRKTLQGPIKSAPGNFDGVGVAPVVLDAALRPARDTHALVLRAFRGLRFDRVE